MFSKRKGVSESMKHIFRAYDIRGIWNKDLDPSISLDIGRGLGSFLGKDMGFKGVALGYDVRTTSKAMEGAIVTGLLSTGIDVLSLGRCSFGTAMMAGWMEGCDASCYITASHLTPEWNGLKVYYGDGVGFPEENIMAVRDRFLKRDFSVVEWDGMGKYIHMDYTGKYVEFWKSRYLQALKGGERTGVGVDCGGGSMCLSAPHVMNALEMDAHLVNCDVDPLFRNRPSEPSPENLVELRNTVLENDLEFGIAFDGDGDRAVVVDDRGRFLSSDRLGIIIALDIVNRKGGGLVLANVESSMAVEDVLLPAGAEVKRIRVGHTFLTLEAKLNNAVFGVEKSGHLIVPEHVLFDDAMVAPLELLRILNSRGRPLSSFVDDVPQYPSSSRTFDCSDDLKFEIVDRLREDLMDDFERVNTMDGVRVDTDAGWVLIRCSNTSPVIRMTVEGRDDASLSRLTDQFSKRLIEKISGR
ncbi:MAG: hypothetical protein ACMUIG_00850 [Thermoplasmatota archaeon]